MEAEIILQGGKPYRLMEIISEIKKGGYDGSYVVEATLGLGGINLKKLRNFLIRIRELVEEA